MTTLALHGNHDPCPACALRREMQDTAPVYRKRIPCNVCGGGSFLTRSDAEIVRRTIEEAKRLYWPLFYARTGLSPDLRPRPAPGPEALFIQLPLPVVLDGFGAAIHRIEGLA